MSLNKLQQEINPVQTPSVTYLYKKEFQDFRNLQKTISLKEVSFRDSMKSEVFYALETVKLEKELGELYKELMCAAQKLNIISNG